VLKATGAKLQLMQASRYLDHGPSRSTVGVLDPPCDECAAAICATLEAACCLRRPFI